MDADLVGQIGRLLDRQAIFDCVQRYARGTDRDDIDLVSSCFHADAIYDRGSQFGGGRSLAQRTSESHRNLVDYQHHLTTHSVDLDGDTAHAETYWLSVQRHDNGKVTLATGRYLDRFERRDGEWLIAGRICTVSTKGFLVEADMAAINAAFVRGTHDRSDPSYMRPLSVVPHAPK